MVSPPSQRAVPWEFYRRNVTLGLLGNRPRPHDTRCPRRRYGAATGRPTAGSTANTRRACPSTPAATLPHHHIRLATGIAEPLAVRLHFSVGRASPAPHDCCASVVRTAGPSPTCATDDALSPHRGGGPGPSARSSCACRRVAWRCRAPRVILLQPYALDDLAVLHTVGRRDGELGHRLPENEPGHMLLLHHPGADVEARAYC